ncbi:MAG: GNAT family N-acetyltransferase [Acidimicrobiales bacterium]
MAVEEVTEVTAELVGAFARLVPQLSSSAPPPGADGLAEMVAHPGTTLFLARDNDGTIVGAMALAVFRIPTGVRAHIEDVIVDGEARGRGAGAALVRSAVAKAERAGACTVDLTSRPHREAANRLYARCGFTQRDTNVWRLDLRA